jgi:hypothetical protein
MFGDLGPPPSGARHKINPVEIATDRTATSEKREKRRSQLS